MKKIFSAEVKPLFNEKRIPLHDVLPLDTPMAFGVGVSQLCNIRCKYCFHALTDKQLAEQGFKAINMDMAIFRKMVELLKEFPNRINSISMAGQGEPLCNPQFAEMVKIIKDADISDDVSTITNGLLLNKNLIENIVDAGLDRIFISIQGMSSEKYEEICGRSIDFQSYIDNIKYLYRYSRGKCKVNIKIADIALKNGEKEVFFEKFGNICDRIHIETIKPLYSGVDYSGILDQNLTDMTTTRFGRVHKIQKACYLAFYMMCLNPDGNIKTCGTPFPGMWLGNIQDRTLVEAWNSSERKEFLLSMLRGERENMDCCRDCDFPNDVPSENDEIDPYADELIRKFER